MKHPIKTVINIENYNCKRVILYISTRRYKILVYDLSNDNNDTLIVLKEKKYMQLSSISITSDEFKEDCNLVLSKIKKRSIRKLFRSEINKLLTN